MIGGVARRVSSPVLVGRAAEVAQLRAALERAACGRPATVVVAGEAGVGKTRLVAELVRQAGGLGAVALTGGWPSPHWLSAPCLASARRPDQGRSTGRFQHQAGVDLDA
jgi:MoxR-like ATPase